MKQLSEFSKEIKHLAWCVPGYIKLSKHERQQVLNDTLIKIIEKIESGVIKDGDNYENYKSYMFITTKNFINRTFEASDRTYNGIGRKNQVSIDTEEFIEPNPTYHGNQIDMKRLLKNLSPTHRAYIRFIYKHGWSRKYLAEQIDIPPSSFDKIINRILARLKNAATQQVS